MLASPLVQRLRGYLDDIGKVPERKVLEACLRSLAKWRSQMLANTIVSMDGTRVQAGLFAGMDYINDAAEGALAARLLGSYEAELHPHLRAFVDAGLDHILDIGCAEGYYAVGLARLMPDARVHAFDIDPRARSLCGELASKNHVSIEIGGTFSGEDFARYGGRTLVFVDIEGGEQELLDPDRFPALRGMSVIVETHPALQPGVTGILKQRFSTTHHIEQVDHHPQIPKCPTWMQRTNHLDMVLLAWEWRNSATPWLVMRPR